MQFDPAPITGEITTATDTTPEAEPRLTLSQLQALLREAAAYERAQRPVVLHGPHPYPAPAHQAAPATHPGIDVRIPGPPAAPVAAQPGERSPWPLAFMVSACVGIGSCLVTAVTGSAVPMAVTLAAFAVWGTATYQLVFVRER